jgi:1,4-dihydroxy-6-naphthoate synthase
MNRALTLAYSPCPNDTFLFHALAHGLVEVPGVEFRIELHDVEVLNQAALAAQYDVTKLSFAALDRVLDNYALLRSGAALGRGCGPLVVARPGFDPSRLANVKVAVPGLLTTARRLLELYLNKKIDTAPLVFDQIMPAVAAGRFEFGVIIHEGRFTYQDHGLVQVVDLGQWWETERGLPIPLGGIVVRRDLGPDRGRQIERAIRDSVLHARRSPEASAEYVAAHAQEMDPQVTCQHIELYVNDFTVALGEAGERAVRAFLGLDKTEDNQAGGSSLLL